MTDTDAGTVAGAVEQRDRSRGVVARAKAAQEWFGILGPSHANPAAFVQLSLAQLSKVKDLREAADANPAEFLSVMAECARLGLMPGTTFFYIPFKSKYAPYWSIAGIIHWTGEVELMYRTGVISAVAVQEVRARDFFAWDPSTMLVPEHHIAPAEGTEQLGLAEAGDRGKITGVYCYVRFKDGTTSFPTVMTAGEVGKHRKISRAGEDFWGKWDPAGGHAEVTDEGPWTVDMVKKTAVHKHRPSVPSSPEYMQQVAASMARALKNAPEGVSIQPADQPAVDHVPPGLATIEGNGERPSPATIVGAVTGGDQGKPMNKGDALNRIADTFRAAGLGGPQWRITTVKIAASLSMPEGEPAPQIARLSDLRADQARTAAQRLDDVMAVVGGDADSARDTLLRAALDDRLWDGTDPPAPDGFVIDAEDRANQEEDHRDE